MKYFGVVYDVGLHFSGTNHLSVKHFDPVRVETDMRAIATVMHANAVRIEGEDIERLKTASRIAHEQGLSIFYSPWKMDAGLEENKPFLQEAAAAAEELRLEGADIVFVTACEYTIFNDGIYPGSSLFERSSWAYDQLDGKGWPYTPEGLPSPFPEKAKELNDVLATLVETVRATFRGQQTYSAAIFEEVDWSLFDFVGTNYYREKQTDEEYRAGLEYFSGFGKPVAVMEVGCCAYEGAAARGSRGWRILSGTNPDGSGIFENGVVPTRSEREQADYVERQLKFFAEHGVHSAFLYVFAQEDYPTGEGALDLDMGAFGLVKKFRMDDPRSHKTPDWEAKEAFLRAGEFFHQHAAAIAGKG